MSPGCGSGLFLALAPAAAPLTGVELDPSTAAIAQLLNPTANVLTGSFSEVRLKDASFALAIGNVPFADYVEYDPKYNAARHTLHNYFLVKSLRLLEPGAVAVLISTHFTLDATSAKARREMAALGELVEVVRLPTGAHSAMAGTEALTDILVFRRHADDQAATAYVDSHPDWLDAVEMALRGRLDARQPPPGGRRRRPVRARHPGGADRHVRRRGAGGRRRSRPRAPGGADPGAV